MIIHLQQLSFFCHHGLFEEEKLTGGTFIVNLEVEVNDPATLILSINETVNYEAVYELVNIRMMKPTPLLETLVMQIADTVLASSPLIKKVCVSITKLAAPIANFQGQVGITYCKQR